jgi:putative flavoprotein involved in K+ transport
MTEQIDVVVVGGGQAGLAVSYFLKQAGVEHVVLEAGRVAETWRSRRWDSFRLVTPNWSMKLPGAEYDGPDPDGFMPLSEIVDRIQGWADSFRAPVRTGVEVRGLKRANGGFELAVAGEKLQAGTVVVATGAYQRAHFPRGAEMVPPSVGHFLAEEYDNPDTLPPGAVLIIGSGQTGCQLAEELHETGRRVFLACGRTIWSPRRLGDRDCVWWMEKSGWFDRPVDALSSPAARLLSNPALTGHDGGHDLNLRSLHGIGVELVGRFIGADSHRVYFADDLAASADFGDARMRDFYKFIERACEAAGWPAPDFEMPEPIRMTVPTELDLERENITSIVWTSGFRPDYGWVDIPVFDDMGFPIQKDGATSVPGLYFCGVHWLRKHKSAILYGVGEDAQVITQHIVEHRS